MIGLAVVRTVPSVFGAPSFVVRYNPYTLTDASPADVHRLLYLERELRKEVWVSL